MSLHDCCLVTSSMNSELRKKKYMKIIITYLTWIHLIDFKLDFLYPLSNYHYAYANMQ